MTSRTTSSLLAVCWHQSTRYPSRPVPSRVRTDLHLFSSALSVVQTLNGEGR
jgi:hypothetical protein